MMKNIVIKLGGSSLQDASTLKELTALVRDYRACGFRVVVVHGGGPAINAELSSRGIEWTFVSGQRRTTPEMIEAIDEVLSVEVNGAVVESLREAGLPAVGVSGARDRILLCRQQSEELGLVGEVRKVNTQALPPAPMVAVVAPVGYGAAGEKYNVNADWAATKIAVALKAHELVFLTDQFGILNRDCELLPSATPGAIHRLIQEGTIAGGMRTKTLAMIAAMAEGVGQVRVLKASQASALFGEESIGTRLWDPAKADRRVLHVVAS